MIMVVGTLTIFLVGVLLTKFKKKTNTEPEAVLEGH